MFVNKKVLKELINLNKSIIDKLSVKNVSPKEMTPEIITLDAQIKAANARMKIGSNNSEGVNYESIELESVYSKIQDNQIPSEYSWVYYKEIMNVALIWLNRYSKFETTTHSKEEIINAIFVCILYGMSAYDTKNKKAFYVSYENNQYWGYPINDTYQQNFFKWDKGWSVNPEYNTNRKPLKKEDIVLFEWQMGKIGIFVWYLQDLLNYLVVKDILYLNTNALGASLMVEVKDKLAFKKQLEHLLNPRKLVKTFVLNDSNDMNKILNVSPDIAPHCETLMNTLRFLKEEMYNTWGIKITSAKSQSLSSDANLSASISATIAWEHDRRIIAAMKELGINFKINEPEIIQPMNQNADKQGEGETNTEAYLNARKSE